MMNMAATRKRPRFGDVFEIRTTDGFGYFQYVDRDPIMGPRIRVLPEIFAARPDVRTHTAKKALYMVHFPLGAAAWRGLVTVVANEPLPVPGAESDLFRLMEIWNDIALANRMLRGWTPV
jgi:hypothetical protein